MFCGTVTIRLNAWAARCPVTLDEFGDAEAPLSRDLDLEESAGLGLLLLELCISLVLTSSDMDVFLLRSRVVEAASSEPSLLFFGISNGDDGRSNRLVGDVAATTLRWLGLGELRAVGDVEVVGLPLYPAAALSWGLSNPPIASKCSLLWVADTWPVIKKILCYIFYI